MELPEKLRSKRVDQPQQHWTEEFGVIPRFLRAPDSEIREFLVSLTDPTVQLRLGPDAVEVVIKLHPLSKEVPSKAKDWFEQNWKLLPECFEEILWQTYPGKGITVWSVLSRAALDGYQFAWLRLFERLYTQSFGAHADQALTKLKDQLATDLKQKKVGRRQVSSHEIDVLRRAYDRLLPRCEVIHNTVKVARSDLDKQNIKHPTDREIRAKFWALLPKEVRGMEARSLIFGGDAFRAIPYRKANLAGAFGSQHDIRRVAQTRLRDPHNCQRPSE
jgi:hypothetical protein